MGFEALFIFFNLVVVLMTIFVFLGIAAAISLEPALAQLESLYASKNDWNARGFDENMTLQSAQTLTTAFYIVGSIACLVISIMLLALFIKGI